MIAKIILRHPMAKCHPSFIEVASSLCLPNSHLLHWAPEDIDMAANLGGEPSFASNM